MFELTDDWHEGLDAERARARMMESPYPPWPDISPNEEIGLGWTLLVGDRQDELMDVSTGVPGFRWSAVGILDSSVDPSLEGQRQTFGVIFYVEDPLAEAIQIGEITIDGVTLPIVQRPATIEDHRVGGTVPISGQLACWATTSGGKREGWLTADHVARNSPGLRIVDAGRQCIDAALVDDGTRGGGNPTRAVAPAAGMTVEVFGNPMWTATITDVSSTLGSLNSHYFPLRFSFTHHGYPGDSGSLIRADPCDEPTGIYLGALKLSNSVSLGIGLAICQLESLMDMEVYV